MKTFRLIWFQHLHKAAGSSIVNQAIENDENLYPKHYNGRPFNSIDEPIFTKNPSDKDLSKFIDHCEKEGITFIATEFVQPNFKVLASDPRIKLLTCLRNPLDRFISNFYYDKYNLYTQVKTIEDYLNSGGIITQPNYYCKVFSRNESESIQQESFNEAVSNLSSFDIIILQEKNESFDQLRQKLNWQIPTPHKNTTRFSLHTIYKLLFNGNIFLLKKYLINPKNKISNSFQNDFKMLNYFDYELYKITRSKLV